MARIYDKLKVPTLNDAHETLGEAFLNLKTSCQKMTKLINKDLIKFFRYHKYELNAIEDLLNSWSDKRSELSATEKKLREKKDMLFTQQHLAKWGLGPDCKIPVDTLLNNKIIAFKEMLPNETREAHIQRIHYGFYANKIIEEFTRMNKKEEEDIKSHFLKVARDSCDIFEEINVLWADMVAHFTQIKDVVDTSDEKIVRAHEQLPENTFAKKEELAAMKKKN
jgi:hypothetical protein